MSINRGLFPYLAQYLDGPPQRLESYPTALTKSDFSLILRQQLLPYMGETALPPKLRTLLLTQWAPGDWIPETVYVALCAIARDQLWKTDEAYHQGMLDVATEMYKGPLYRALFVMLGPSIVAMSAAKRWHNLHQGTDLVMKKQNKDNADLILTFPPKLYSEVGARSLGAAFCAIAQGSRGKDASCTILSLSDTEAEILVRWTY